MILIRFLSVIIISNAYLSACERKDDLSIPVPIPGALRPLLSSRSPSEFMQLDSRSEEEKTKEWKRQFHERTKIKVAFEATNHITHEALAVINETIQETFSGSISLGDPKIDQHITLVLEKIKKGQIRKPTEEELKQSPHENLLTHIIRSNPALCARMDKQIHELAQLLNEIMRAVEEE